ARVRAPGADRERPASAGFRARAGGHPAREPDAGRGGGSDPGSRSSDGDRIARGGSPHSDWYGAARDSTGGRRGRRNAAPGDSRNTSPDRGSTRDPSDGPEPNTGGSSGCSRS